MHDVAHTNVAFMFGEELGALHTESDLARRSPTEAGLYDLGRCKKL